MIRFRKAAVVVLVSCAIGAHAQSIVENSTFDEGAKLGITNELSGEAIPSSMYGWSILAGDGSVYVNQSSIGPEGQGDPSAVVFDNGSGGGIVQAVNSDAPYLRVSAQVFVRYGGVLLACGGSLGDFTPIDGTSATGEWITLSGTVPNMGGANAIQVVGNGDGPSAFAVDNVVVVPIYSNDDGQAAIDWPQSVGATAWPEDATSQSQYIPSDVLPPDYVELSSTIADLRRAMSLYEMANGFGSYGKLSAYEPSYIPSTQLDPEISP